MNIITEPRFSGAKAWPSSSREAGASNATRVSRGNPAGAAARMASARDGLAREATTTQGLPAISRRTLYVREFVHINFPVHVRLVAACPPIVAPTEASLQLWSR